MQNGGVEIVDVHDVFHGVIAEIVGVAVAHAALDAAAGEPAAEALDVVIAPAALRHRRAAKFGAPQDESVFPQTGTLKILDQRRDALIDDLSGILHGALNTAVMIPTAVIELDEPHAALGQAPGEQAVAGKRAIAGLCTVQVKNALGFPGNIDQLRHAHLHAEGHLVLRNARDNFRILHGGILQLIELLHSIHNIALAIGIHAIGAFHIENGIALPPQLHALKTAGQKARVPLPGGHGLVLSAAA